MQGDKRRLALFTPLTVNLLCDGKTGSTLWKIKMQTSSSHAKVKTPDQKPYRPVEFLNIPKMTQINLSGKSWAISKPVKGPKVESVGGLLEPDGRFLVRKKLSD